VIRERCRCNKWMAVDPAFVWNKERWGGRGPWRGVRGPGKKKPLRRRKVKFAMGREIWPGKMGGGEKKKGGSSINIQLKTPFRFTAYSGFPGGIKERDGG